MTKKPAKKCAVLSEFLFRLFCRSCRRYGCTELSSRITTQKYSWYASILPKNQRFCGKRKAEIDVHKYPSTEAQIYFPATLKKKEIFNGNYIITHKTPIGCK